VFDLNQVKSDVIVKLKEHLLPEEQSGTTTFDLNRLDQYYVVQSFKPYSTAYREDNRRSFPIEISIKKTGTPTGSMYVYLLVDSDNTPSSTITGRTLPPGSIGASFVDVAFYMDQSDLKENYKHLGSKNRYWFEISTGQTIDPSNYYSIERSDVDTGYLMGSGQYRASTTSTWTTLAADLNFRVSMPTWIYPDYPYDNLSIYSYPRIAVDIVGRPRVDQRWISHRLADYILNIGITFYSRYPNELDELISYADRALWYERINIDALRIANPGNISTAVSPKEGIFVRTMLYQGVHRESADEIT